MNKKFIVFFLVFGLMFLGFGSFDNNNLIEAITGSVILSENNSLENVSESKTKRIAGNVLESDDEILKAFDKGEENVRVIVLDKKSSDNSKIKTYKNKINKNKIKHSYSSVNGFSAEITLEEFEVLKNSGLHILKDKSYHANLDVSIPQINADDSWNLKSNNLNITGSGQTVCIIDTGVNYNHSAFGNCYGENNASSSCKIIGGYDFVNDNEFPMDDNGHGTHVAGIVASVDSTYRGVSPDVKIISIKALNNEGGGWGTDIVAGIDWCVNNASKFNISVISMSLGDNSMHNSYCNSDESSGGFYSYIANAVANNITVVISAGNCDQSGQENCTIGVASPACVESAIIAGAVNDTDDIWFMRGSLLELMAPGVDIMSALYTGGYTEHDGTSMSAPHIAGAVALINQYLSLSGQTKTPSEIEIILNNTGKILDDTSESGYNFSRIDVYSAILSLDIDSPNVTLVSPADDKVNLTINQTFICNATDWQLANVTLKIWNSTGELYYNTTNNLTETANGTSFDKDNMSEGSYFWNCFVIDVEGNSGNATNYTLIIGGISASLISPKNNSYTNVNEINFTCNLTSEETHELSNVTFYLWNSSALVINETKNISGTNNETTFAYNLTEEAGYSWNCLGINNASCNSSAGNNFTITYDATAPNISLVGSLPTSVTSNSVSKDFSFNVSDDNIANCSLIVEESINLTNSSVNVSLTQLFSRTFTPGTYSWKINCSDLAGNMNSSEEHNFTITAEPSSPTSPGGGSSSSSTISIATAPKVYESTVSEITRGYTQKLKKNEKINFSIFDFDGEKHLLSVKEVGIDYVDLTIESEPINLRLGIGQSAKLNLTSEVYYDLLIKLNSIIEGTAELTIQLINEPIEVQTTEIIKEEIIKIETIEAKGYFWLVVILVVVLILILTIVIRLNKEKLKAPEPKKKYRKRKKLKAPKPKKRHGKKRKKIKT